MKKSKLQNETSLKGWLILPKKKNDRSITLRGSTYLTLFRDKGYRNEFRKRWTDGDNVFVQATLIVKNKI